MKIYKSVLTCLLFLCPLLVHPVNPLLTDIKILGLREASAPERLEDRLLFTYTSPLPVRRVGLRFAHEDYAVFHLYTRNGNGVFVLLYKPPEGLRRLKYRLCVDGLWSHDPFNPSREQEDSGLTFSLLTLTEPGAEPRINPRLSGGNRARFVFRGPPARAVSIVGSFNAWDPTLHRLAETEPGLYQISLELLPGQYYYTFLLDGDRILDPYNLNSARDYEGQRVSTFTMPPPKT
jgi:hypothetical protein